MSFRFGSRSSVMVLPVIVANRGSTIRVAATQFAT
jgi:hypothetical protein